MLPRDYRIVYREMKSYMWRFTADDGMDIVAILADVLAEFEDGCSRRQTGAGGHGCGRRGLLRRAARVTPTPTTATRTSGATPSTGM